ncbi:DUF488 domain-containing protein [Tenacibaculum mesophilum]|uniref:DUF488 domain-containing protein n=1 Tax=Tenacibaculum mesophilum TaxID=104268 RepID=A0AAE9SIA5_9FLAO|nr:DUF488 domain-containing protein [Tenacibaculum mesophilum]UTD15406.1 DUF488 domain-containing protein [Tenacibaculum mesophilum]
MTTIFSIGHGRSTIESFMNILKQYKIDFLYDVRSRPMSKYNFQFNKTWLEVDLPKEGITYKFVGDNLGGLPKDASCYTNGKVDYSKIREKDFFNKGVMELVQANKNRLRIALMCSESNPQDCHRSKLIGQELLKYKISVNHIVDGKIKDQNDVINELTKGKGTVDLFGENDFNSRNVY